MTDLIRTKSLTKVFHSANRFFFIEKKDVTALSDINFSIARGECFGLTGESGCGKTTLGRTLLKLTAPTSGEIYFAGKKINQLNGSELAVFRAKSQIIYQDADGSLDPRWSINRTLEEPLRSKGLSRSSRKEKIRESITKVGVGPELLGRRPHELSGGQRQRVGIAR
ncbi:MAG: ATP-binding cassette domain-containing protein, partial [Desulfobulbaceae bacterium]|nr:ATP-binding cassette domain-containing protein [Desulfobulbaceae bacterium]